ncbi:MAG TPA: zinc ribbon domain-containing protein [Ottowia sp.]|nr:zinc ribbon domain-containing protein [Ottowia sp.]HRL67522.1 zinc ribbon domain-containing protein [Ottowia sp.]
MPIYAYKCAACGFAKDILQKMSDAPLTECPSCGQPAFSKQLTAPGFQLKGSGWYVTDFRDGQKKSGGGQEPAAEGAKPESGKTEGAAPASAPASAPAPASSPAPAAPPPAGGGGSSSSSSGS